MTRNKGEQIVLPLKLLSPEKSIVGDGRSFHHARRLHLKGRYWLVLPGTPGSKDISSHTLRTKAHCTRAEHLVAAPAATRCLIQLINGRAKISGKMRITPVSDNSLI